MVDAKVTSGPAQVHAVDIVSESFLAHLETVAMHFLLRCVTVLALITPVSLASSCSFAILILLERVMTF